LRKSEKGQTVVDKILQRITDNTIAKKKWTQRQTMVGDCTEKPDNTIVNKRKTNVGNMINMEKTDKTLTK
jgi:hypothetical protein